VAAVMDLIDAILTVVFTVQLLLWLVASSPSPL
jgi:hypothetical protein